MFKINIVKRERERANKEERSRGEDERAHIIYFRHHRARRPTGRRLALHSLRSYGTDVRTCSHELVITYVS